MHMDHAYTQYIRNNQHLIVLIFAQTSNYFIHVDATFVLRLAVPIVFLQYINQNIEDMAIVSIEFK